MPIAFNILDNDNHMPIGYKEIKCYVIFDVKIGTLQYKSCYVAGSYITDLLSTQTYSSIVLQEFICIILTIITLNSLSVITRDLENTYLQMTYNKRYGQL